LEHNNYFKNVEQVIQQYDLVVGIEVHVQLNTKTKMWCNCEISKSSFENQTVCAVCTAQPGTLPVINRAAIRLAGLAALASGCTINKFSKFDRKNYFYPDLPKGYQITQFVTPIAEGGSLDVTLPNNEKKKIRITRIQLEEDTGKSVHHENYSLVNLNRAGTPLIEIITEPDISSSVEAVAYLKKLHANMVYLEVTQGNMQDGNFRCDINISLKPKGSIKLGIRVEVKNLNSFKSVEKAIEYEMVRQANLLRNGEKILQQTLLFDADKLQTKAIRTKTDADDYRYFAEPDLMPLIISDEQIGEWRSSLPELPDAKQTRLVTTYGITPYDAEVLCQDRKVVDYFEEGVSIYPASAKKIANWILSALLHYLNEAHLPISKSPISALHLAELVKMIDEGIVSSKMAKEIFVEMFDSKKSAKEIVGSKGLQQNSDESQLEKLVDDLISKFPQEVAELKGGRERVMGFFVGHIMKDTQGKANPKLTTDLIRKKMGI